mgnify:FL=1
MFLYIDPLKQGLKLEGTNSNQLKCFGFLYIDPLKQGLKRKRIISLIPKHNVFIHRSIKTRIETPTYDMGKNIFFCFYT